MYIHMLQIILHNILFNIYWVKLKILMVFLTSIDKEKLNRNEIDPYG